MLATLHAFPTRKRGYFSTKTPSEGISDKTESENVPYWRKKNPAPLSEPCFHADETGWTKGSQRVGKSRPGVAVQVPHPTQGWTWLGPPSPQITPAATSTNPWAHRDWEEVRSQHSCWAASWRKGGEGRGDFFLAKEKTISLGSSPLQMTVLFRKALHRAAPSTVWAQHRELGLGWAGGVQLPLGMGQCPFSHFSQECLPVVVRYKRQGVLVGRGWVHGPPASKSTEPATNLSSDQEGCSQEMKFLHEAVPVC